MAAMDLFLFLLSSSFLFCVHNDLCQASKLNVPKLLLPYYSQVATSFTLEAIDGCFIWRSSRPEVASVRPVGTSDPLACSRTALVTSVSAVSTRRTTIVTAEESVTGQELRCDVIVDEITQMAIETTTKELFLDDSPEEFIIRARNDKNDVFSSLDGMLFDWSLISDADSGEPNAANVLRLLKFSESSYTALPHIKQLEENSKRGDRILMRGLQTGGAIVSVKPVDPAYRHLPDLRVRVLVVANLQLSPSVVYILPHMTVTYKVELLKQGKAHEVTMPSKQYRLELGNTTFAKLDPKTSTVTGVEFGFTELKLKDLTLQPSDTLREPSAGIYVVSPAYLEFTVNPDPNWLLETNRTYIVYVNVFDGENRKIYPSKNLRVTATFPDRHFRRISASANGTYYVVETLRKGFVNLYAQLKSVTAANGKEITFEKPVDGTQEVEIFEPIVLLPERVVLPWEPSGSTIQFQFKVSGGSGNYSWHSSNPSAADVQPSGLVTVGSTIGSITVKASDVRNVAHFDASQVVVVPPSRLAFLPSKVEAEIGSSLKLPIALFGQLDNKEVSFDDCHTIALTILLSDSNIFRQKSVTKSSTENACADLLLEATGVGHIEVTVAYEINRIKLKATQVVAAYTPLTAFQPNEVAVVTLGSSLDVVFAGGPRPWVLDASGFFQAASFEKEKLVTVGKPRISDASKHHHSVVIRCVNFGEQLLTLTVGNKPTAKNPFPATSVATVLYACESPKGLHLFPSIEHPANLPPCPISAEFDDPVPVPLKTEVMMVAVLTDRLGRKFGNFSSLVVDWQVSNSNLGKFSNHLQVVTDRKPLTNLDYKWISLSDVGGPLTVTVQIDKYNSRFVDSWFSDKAVSPPIVKSRILQLVGYPKFSPSQVIMFNHAQVKASIGVVNGSGHYKVDQNERASEIARITYNTDQKSDITVVPISEGSVVLSVADLCLSPMQSATATIFVSDIAQILLQVVDKVELHHEVEVRVKVVDGNDLPIDSSYFSLMNVEPVSRSDFISVRKSSDSTAADRLTAVYIVRGESLGRAFLQVSAISKMGKKIMSSSKEIQVFPPLHLKPKNITIIPGTFFQVMAFGGPQPESTIEFTIKNERVANVSNNGLITALELGSTQIIAMATGFDANNSSRVVFSQDYAVVNVVELNEVRIVTPLKRIQSGEQMPVYAIGLNENVTPFSFANVVPPLRFRWIIASEHVALVRPVYHESGVDMSDEGNFAMRFHALSSGLVTLELVVTSQHSKMNTMKDKVTIQVFDHLSFLSPPISDGVILMMPNTEMFVKTNRDGSTAQLSYAVVDPDSTSTDHRPPVVSVSQIGLLTCGGFPGQAHLRVTAQEEFGVNHTMVILVKVKPLSYIMINTDTVIRAKSPGISSFPIGTKISFVVSLHDDVGEQFHATQSNIHFHINKYDQIQMLYGKTNNSLAARATSAGFTVLKVYEKSNPLITDYIGIPVNYAIQPSQSEVTLGSTVCFSSHLLTREGHLGEWVSNGEVISVDRTSGVAFANRIGSSYITYNVSYVATQTSLKVVPLTSISLKETGSLPFLTNVVTEKVNLSRSAVQVIIENLELKLTAGLQGTNCSEVIRAHSPGSVDVSFLSCSIAFSESTTLFGINEVAHVTPTFDTATGLYYCHVTVAVAQSLAQPIASFKTNMTLSAKVLAQDGQAELTSKSLDVPFHPAFFIMNRDLILKVNQATINLRVVATEAVLKELQVISNDESLVRVRFPYSQSTPADGTVTFFPVDLQLTSHMWNAAPTGTNLTVTCTMTGQSQLVTVAILKGDQTEMSWGHLLSALLHKYSNFFFLIICLIATISCIIIAYHLVYGQQYHYPGAGASMASSAFLSSPSSSRGQSPFTPAYPSQSPPSSSSPRMWTTDHSPYSNGVGHRPPRRPSGLGSGLDKSF